MRIGEIAVRAGHRTYYGEVRTLSAHTLWVAPPVDHVSVRRYRCPECITCGDTLRRQIRHCHLGRNACNATGSNRGPPAFGHGQADQRVLQSTTAPSPTPGVKILKLVAMDGFTGFKSATAEELPRREGSRGSSFVVHLWPGCSLDGMPDAPRQSSP